MTDIAPTYDNIVEANNLMHLTPIQNKDYAEVPQRVKGFRYLYPNGSIETELVSNENGVAIIKATVKDGNGKVLSTGTAYEKEGAGFINKTSYIENCETSAVGRALGFLGLGIDTSIASFEEVANAKEQQKKPAPAKTQEQTEQADAVEDAKFRTKVLAYVRKSGMSEDNIAKLCKFYKVEKLTQLTAKQCAHYLEQLKKKGIQIEEDKNE